MNLETPLVSVVMPVYNGALYVGEAVESILNQSYSNFEFLIFNDGSTDQTCTILASFSDPRIKIFNFENNQGYVDHLNQGILLAKGKYIARMDADDISLPTRLEEQVKFFEENPDYGVLGTSAKSLGKSTAMIIRPREHQEILTHLLFYTTIIHPSVMYRAALLRKHQIYYSKKHELTEDYEIFLKLSKLTKLANLPGILMRYRIHSMNISKLYFESQMQILYTLRIEEHQHFLQRALSDWEKDFLSEKLDFNLNELRKSKAYLRELMNRNEATQRLPAKDFRSFLIHRIFYMIFKNPNWRISFLLSIPFAFWVFPAFFYKKYTYRFFVSVTVRNVKKSGLLTKN